MTNTSINDLHAARVLEFTRAEAILKALIIDIDNLKSSLTSNLTNCEKTLDTQLAEFRHAATDEWLKGSNAGLGAVYYDHARTAAIGRARSLERRALAAAEAAQALAFVLEAAETVITADELATRIDDLARDFHDGAYSTDTAAEADLIAMWQALTSSPFVAAEAVEILRRRYDAQITGPYIGNGLPTLYAAVTEWRGHYLANATWDAPTWDYAVDTIRSWDEAHEYWKFLGSASDYTADLSPAQNVRLRTAIAYRVTHATPNQDPPPADLVEDVAAFDNAHLWMLTRARSAETMHDLKIVSDALAARGHDVEHALIAMRALARKYDDLTTSAPDADPEGNEWHPAAILSTRVNLWRAKIYRNALECTTARGAADLTEEDRYRLLDCALADARQTGHTGNVNNLLDRIDRVAEAAAEHILTADHITKLRAGFTQDNTTAININGGTN